MRMTRDALLLVLDLGEDLEPSERSLFADYYAEQVCFLRHPVDKEDMKLWIEEFKSGERAETPSYERD